ncbi:hypothetical protein BDN70DRAFT_935176 [Pholiota conissans]|uniref:F-box domain-containing protein n=1 Tax=Pholiota conissans TaxID=109636 RepID=A0A9P6CXG3_9AGAR|nr:hypothetical protein BDN70DRAFT_935176 [Pholiota conissans]
METDLKTIAEEILIQILSDLDALSLVRFSMTCKTIYETCKKSSLLQCIIQLHLNGKFHMQDSESVGMSRSYLLNQILRQRQAYIEPKWSINASVAYQSPSIDFNFSAGIYINNYHWSLEYAVLPSIGVVELRPIRTVSTQIRNFIANPAANLLIYVEADNDIPPVSTTTTRLRISTAVEAFRECQPRVTIWNWITSELLLDSCYVSTPLFPSNVAAFGLLYEQYFFVVSGLDSGAIHLYKVDKSSAILLARLHLPPTAPNIQISSISTRAGAMSPNLFSSPRIWCQSGDRLHVITLVYDGANPDQGLFNRPLDLFVHQRVFAMFCEVAPRYPVALDIPWAHWCPTVTRMFFPGRLQSWIPGLQDIHGQHVVVYRKPRRDEHEKSKSIEILDFSLAAVMYARGMSGSMTEKPPLEPSLERSVVTLLPPGKIDASQTGIFLEGRDSHAVCVYR